MTKQNDATNTAFTANQKTKNAGDYLSVTLVRAILPPPSLEDAVAADQRQTSTEATGSTTDSTTEPTTEPTTESITKNPEPTGDTMKKTEKDTAKVTETTTDTAGPKKKGPEGEGTKSSFLSLEEEVRVTAATEFSRAKAKIGDGEALASLWLPLPDEERAVSWDMSYKMDVDEPWMTKLAAGEHSAEFTLETMAKGGKVSPLYVCTMKLPSAIADGTTIARDLTEVDAECTQVGTKGAKPEALKFLVEFKLHFKDSAKQKYSELRIDRFGYRGMNLPMIPKKMSIVCDITLFGKYRVPDWLQEITIDFTAITKGFMDFVKSLPFGKMLDSLKGLVAKMAGGAGAALKAVGAGATAAATAVSGAASAAAGAVANKWKSMTKGMFGLIQTKLHRVKQRKRLTSISPMVAVARRSSKIAALEQMLEAIDEDENDAKLTQLPRSGPYAV